MCHFFFNDTATTEIYTLSLHDALPISSSEVMKSTSSSRTDGPLHLWTNSMRSCRGAAETSQGRYVPSGTRCWAARDPVFVLGVAAGAAIVQVENRRGTHHPVRGRRCFLVPF